MLPFAILWIVLAAAGIISAVLTSQPRLRFPLVVVSILAAFGLWLWAGSPTPEAMPGAMFLGYSFAVTPGAWQLTGMVLLLLLTVTTAGWVKAVPGDNPHLSLSLALGILPFIWAGDPLTAVLMLGLFAITWVTVLWRSGGFVEASNGLPRQLALFLLAPLLLVWFADAVALSGSAGPVWVELAAAAVLVGGVLLLGAWPVARWRDPALSGAPTPSMALVGLPPIAGATVLLPVAQQSAAGGTQMALAVILGLSALLLGLRWAWQPLRRGSTSAVGLAGALAGLVLLAAVFASESAMLAATRVAVFAPLTLFLAAWPSDSEPSDSARQGSGLPSWVTVGCMIVVWLAAVGAPLTAGFVTITGLYGSWQFGPNYLLIVILVILLIAWSAALSQHVLRQARHAGTSEARSNGLLDAIPLLMSVIGLIAIDSSALSNAKLLAWLAVLFPLVVGPVMAWLLDGRLEIDEAVAGPLVPRDTIAPVMAPMAKWRAVASDAVAEAVGILEGPSGLFWIVLVVGLLVLLSR